MMIRAAPPLKTMGGGRIGGYLIVWGAHDQRDLHGEYFTPETELALDWYARRPVLYQHGLDEAVKTSVIGAIDTLATDDTGVWAEAQLDLRHTYARAVLGLIDRGALGWSSGSLAHLVDVAEDGHIRRWPVVEGSLTPTPAEPRRTDVRTVKMAFDALGLNTDALALSQGMPKRAGEDTMDQMTMTNDVPRKRLPAGKSGEGERAAVEVGSPFDGLDAFDLLHGYMLMRHARGFQGVTERYANALAHRMRGTGMSAIKADELSRSTLTGYGDEWVPDLWSAQIWSKARQDNLILPALPSVEMLSNPFELPTESMDPTVYFVPETADEAQLTLGGLNPIPDSKIGTGKVTLNARKLALRAGFSAELVEDAIVPVLSLYRAQAVRAITDALDNVILNGDTVTAGTGNINKDHAAPAATDKYLALDGLRKLPLVTNTAAKVDAANVAPTLALLRQARFRLDARYAVRPADLLWIVDSGTYAKLLSLSEFMTMDKVGPAATVLTGQIGMIDGSPVMVSSELPLTEADGKVGAGPNDRGTALCVYRPGWVVGYRRRIAVSVDYISYTDSYQMTATVRLALASYDTKVAAALYNIAV
ncbi:MAG: phage major capsid protein [Pleurocapsa minor GSE-CHR-MK-17-07R]|jgi:HK97 family phage major capsid protein|nr:phage major capsid protein [Pleurocapsa minor GSE-CHR-MK 17-07R]